jgi:proteasome lid subunit RPN8/RPN11
MIQIKNEFLIEMAGHAKSSLPNEVCGLLAGRGGEISKLFRLTNTSDTPELCYFMDAKEQFKTMKEIRQLGLELAGIYHSHPESVAYPSAKDVELAYYPEAIYIIISMKDPIKPLIKAFKIVDGQITEEEIKVI